MFLQSRLKKRVPQEAELLRNLFNKIYNDLHLYIQVRLKAKMFIREALYIRQCHDVLKGILEVGEEPSKVLLKLMKTFLLFQENVQY